ncbi:MAG: acetyl-CoA carboxylase biotin carboxyl carrier protein [Candidatus Eremiobacterota bacterium]
MNLDFNAIQGLIEVSDRCDISELVIEYDGVKIEIRRDRKKDGPSFVLPAGAVYESPPVIQTVQKAEKVMPPVQESKVEEEHSLYYKVLSPLVGVFYKAPWPGAPPFVEIGDKVSAGQTLCIVEAMKLMNEITAEVSGTVVKCLRENEEVVQSGDILFLIDPA